MENIMEANSTAKQDETGGRLAARLILLPKILEFVGGGILRYGLVLFLLGFGALKFTADEAKGIESFIANSPLMFWLYKIFSVQAASEVIGVIEMAIALLIATRAFLPLISTVGSLLAIGMFVSTLSFLFTTPGAASNPDLVFALSKDVFLLGAAVWTAGEALRAWRKSVTLSE